jgi:hypothetical protein
MLDKLIHKLEQLGLNRDPLSRPATEFDKIERKGFKTHPIPAPLPRHLTALSSSPAKKGFCPTKRVRQIVHEGFAGALILRKHARSRHSLKIDTRNARTSIYTINIIIIAYT